MDRLREHLFLEELRFLCQAGAVRGETLLEMGAAWSDSDTQQRALLMRRSERTFDERIEESRTRKALLVEQIHRQGEFFSELDAFLALYGRAALILFPQRETSDPRQRRRAVALRGVLSIGEAHPISDRKLRNKWMHVDEIIDELSFEEADRIVLQKFKHSGRLNESPGTTLRLMVLDEMRIVYAGIGEFKLRELVDTFHDLESRVSAAIETWGDRWLEEILADDRSEV